MATLDEQMSAMALQILKRPMSEEEKNDIYRIADATGMKDVQSFLYLLLVFKLNEDTMNSKFEAMSKAFQLHEEMMKSKFEEMAKIEKKIQGTLESSVERVLDTGAARISTSIEQAVNESVTEGTRETLMLFGEYQSLRGQTILICFICVVSALAYRIGSANFLRAIPSGGFLESLMFLPAGWCVFFCGATYTFFWAADHWKRIKKTKLYKTLLGVQVVLLLILALNMM